MEPVRPVRLPAVEQALAELEAALPDTIEAEDLASWADTVTMLQGYAERFAAHAATLASMCAEAVPKEKKARVFSQGRYFAATGKANRKEWQTDDLLRAVLDSRRFDPRTGGLIEETPIEKLLAVWNLGAPRVTVLEARGIDPDEFCTVEWVGRGVKEVEPK